MPQIKSHVMLKNPVKHIVKKDKKDKDKDKKDQIKEQSKVVTNKINKDLIETEPIINDFTNKTTKNKYNSGRQNQILTNTKTWKHRANRQRITSAIKVVPNEKDLEEYQLHKESLEKTKFIENEYKNTVNKKIVGDIDTRGNSKNINGVEDKYSNNKMDNNSLLVNKQLNSGNLKEKLSLKNDEKIKIEYIEKNRVTFREANIIKGTNKQKKGYDAPINKIEICHDNDKYILIFDINYDSLAIPKDKNNNGYEIYYCQEEDDILLTDLCIGDKNEHTINYDDLENNDSVTFKLVDVHSKESPFVIQQLAISLE